VSAYTGAPVFDWHDRGDAIEVVPIVHGGLQIVIDNDGQRASIELSERAAVALRQALGYSEVEW
jgi:hypothetical protein